MKQGQLALTNVMMSLTSYAEMANIFACGSQNLPAQRMLSVIVTENMRCTCEPRRQDEGGGAH